LRFITFALPLLMLGYITAPARAGGGDTKSGFALLDHTNIPDSSRYGPYPIYYATVKNTTSQSLTIVGLKLHVEEIVQGPLPRPIVRLEPAACWDIDLPRSVGESVFKTEKPILVLAGETALIALRFHVGKVPPWYLGLSYTVSLEFLSGEGLVAKSTAFQMRSRNREP
jgi:hypothetical protein